MNAAAPLKAQLNNVLNSTSNRILMNEHLAKINTILERKTVVEKIAEKIQDCINKYQFIITSYNKRQNTTKNIEIISITLVQSSICL